MLKDQLQEALTTAMKSRDQLRMDTLRMLITALKHEQVSRRRELAEEEELAVLRRGVKSRNDSAELFRKAGRDEMADKELAEIAIIQKYLPVQLGEVELAKAIDAVIEDLGIAGKKDMGRLMKELMSRHEGRIDGRAASKIASSRLS
jgi:uncharacterized protein YqeY